MKIQYASDLHLEFRDNWKYLKEHPLEVSGDILILAGDIGYLGDQNYQNHPFWDWVSENYKEVIVVLGNHEFYKSYDLSSMENGTVGEIRENVKYYYNKVVRIGDVDFIMSTLWSRIDENDAAYTEQCITDFHRIMWGKDVLGWREFNREHERCVGFIKKSAEESTAGHKVVVTHHVPSFLLCATEFEGSRLNGAFAAELRDLIRESDIEYWIYGHSHRNINMTIGRTKCVSNQLGYVFSGEHLGFDTKAGFELG